MTDFDWQWKNLNKSPWLEYNKDRVKEVLEMTGLPREWFLGKYCLDAGCGSGRYTWALNLLGVEHVTSMDESEEAVRIVSKINSDTIRKDILNDLTDWPTYDLVFSFGVIHHTPDPRRAFKVLASLVSEGGYLFVMIYAQDVQDRLRIAIPRFIFHHLPASMRLPFTWIISRLSSIKNFRKPHLHGWWDTLNPKHAYGFTPQEIHGWFLYERFTVLKIEKPGNIIALGRKEIW